MIDKVGAGYVERVATDYRCRDCWKYIPATRRCAELGRNDVVSPNGYCILWAEGRQAQHLEPHGSYTKSEVGYGEDPNGTLCRRCEYFDGHSSCKIVEGTISPHGCCDNQEPEDKKDAFRSLLVRRK